MSNRLVTIATFQNPIEGSLARSRLEDAGIKTFLADEETVGVAWHLSNALGGVKLQVQESDAEEAMTILAEGKDSCSAATPSLPTDVEQPLELGGTDADEPEPVLTNREQAARRAFRGAVLGLLLPPLQLYVFWLLLKVCFSHEPLAADKRRQAIVAAAINLPLMLGFCLLLIRSA